MSDWDGIERRADGSKIDVLEERIKNLQCSVETLNKSVSDLVVKFPALPCSEHKRRIDFLQSVILTVIILGLVLGVWVKTVMGK